MTTTYSTDNDIKSIFGLANWNTWTDLDNTQNGTSMTARSDAARVRAYREINSRLRPTHYRLPIISPSGAAPVEIEYLEATLAGLFLLTARGQEDAGPELAFWRDKSEKTFQDILAGTMRLDAL